MDNLFVEIGVVFLFFVVDDNEYWFVSLCG